MEKIINQYYENNAKKLHNMVDKILFKLRFEVNHEDFYSLANEIFVDVVRRYDGRQSFDAFLYSCLINKIKTEMTRQNRIKRKLKVFIKEKDCNGETIVIEKYINDDSLDRPVYVDGHSNSEETTLCDFIADNRTVEKEIFEDKRDYYSEKMTRYLTRLSDLQKEVLRLISIGFMPNEILEELHINQKMYEDCYQAIHSYRNISLLF